MPARVQREDPPTPRRRPVILPTRIVSSAGVGHDQRRAPFLSFLIFATAIAVAPGPDTFLTLRNTVTRGRDAGTPWGDADASSPPVSAGRCFRQGFLCNITNPKVLAFNLAVLPQFVGDDGGLGLLLMYALTLTAVGAVVLLCVVLAAAHARALLQRPAVSRAVEGGTGVVMLGFAGALALERR